MTAPAPVPPVRTGPASTLIALPLRTAAGDYPMRDVVFDATTGAAPFVLIDMGGLLTRSEALIRSARITGLSEDGDAILSDLTIDEVNDAPHVATDGSAPDMTGWPPVIVGPFGTTQSPLLLSAQIFGATPDRTTDLPPRFDRVTDWIGAPVFGREGEFARIADFRLDLGSGTLTEAILSIGEDSHAVPLSAIRNFAGDEDRYAVTDLSADDLRAGITVAEQGPPLTGQPTPGWVAA